jgi:hypothetical protein
MSTIRILGGTQALAYEFETRLAQLKAADLVDELFDELEQNPHSPEVIAAELLALDLGTAEAIGAEDIGTAEIGIDGLFEPLSDWERPDDCLAVSYESCGDQPFRSALQSTQQLSATANEVTPAAPETSKPAASAGISHRMLVGVTAAALMGVGGLATWLVGQLYWAKPAPVVASAPTTVTVDPATVEFAKYLDQALERLGQETAAQQTANSRMVAGANNPSQPVERVYVPIYQSSAPQPQAPVTAANPTRIPTSSRTAVPLPPPPQARIPGSVQSYLPNPGRRPNRPVSRRSVPLATATVPTGDAKTSVMAVGNNTLIGVLELGERSVAMVEVNGATQRVGIGQTLDSGWQLTQIADQKAILERGGEVRSLSVGQKF